MVTEAVQHMAAGSSFYKKQVNNGLSPPNHNFVKLSWNEPKAQVQWANSNGGPGEETQCTSLGLDGFQPLQ